MAPAEALAPPPDTHGTATITLPVEGMTCAACQANVQRALNATPGVRKAAVNLMLHEAAVVFDPAVISPAAIVEAINETGYSSSLRGPDTNAAADETREQEHAREYRRLLIKSLTSLAIGAVMMGAMLLGGMSTHAGGGAWGWLELAATTVVMAWAGRHFYVRAWKAFRHRTADMNTLIALGTGAAFVYSAVALLAAEWLHGAGAACCWATRWKRAPST
jgi:P-type Cu+ transporter